MMILVIIDLKIHTASRGWTTSPRTNKSYTIVYILPELLPSLTSYLHTCMAKTVSSQIDTGSYTIGPW